MGSDPGGLSQSRSESVSACSANLSPSGSPVHRSMGGVGGGGFPILPAVIAVAPQSSAVDALAVELIGGLSPIGLSPFALADDLSVLSVVIPVPTGLCTRRWRRSAASSALMFSGMRRCGGSVCSCRAHSPTGLVPT